MPNNKAEEENTKLSADDAAKQSIVELALKAIAEKKLYELSDEILKKYFAVLADTGITLLDYSNTNFNKFTLNQLKIIFDRLSKSQIRSLNLANCMLYLLDAERLQVIFDNITKSQVNSLNLKANGLGIIIEASLKVIFENVAKSCITVLQMDSNRLGDSSESCIKIIFDNLARSKVHAYHLGANHIYKLKTDVLRYTFRCVAQRKVTLLDLSSSEFCSMDNAQRLAIFDPFAGKEIETLNLSDNQLAHKDIDLKLLFEAIASINLTSEIILCANHLGALKAERMQILCTALIRIPLFSLNLSGNSLSVESNRATNKDNVTPITILFNYIKKSSLVKVTYSPKDFSAIQEKELKELLEKRLQQHAAWTKIVAITSSMGFNHNSEIRNSIFTLLPEILEFANCGHPPKTFDDKGFMGTLYCKKRIEDKVAQVKATALAPLLMKRIL